MKIPNNQPGKATHHPIARKGDITRELLSAKEAAASVALNCFNIPKLPSHSGKGYFKATKAERLPSAGDTHLVALKTFRQKARKQNFKH